MILVQINLLHQPNLYIWRVKLNLSIPYRIGRISIKGAKSGRRLGLIACQWNLFSQIHCEKSTYLKGGWLSTEISGCSEETFFIRTVLCVLSLKTEKYMRWRRTNLPKSWRFKYKLEAINARWEIETKEFFFFWKNVKFIQIKKVFVQTNAALV